MTHMLDEATHSCLRDTPPTKELHGIPCRILRATSAVHLQECDLARKFRRLLLVRLIKEGHSLQFGRMDLGCPYHIAHLICDVLEPRLDSFCAGDHIRHFGADDRLRAERLPKRLALRDPFQTFLDDHALRASRRANHGPTLVVEVAQDYENSATLRAERVLDRYADVIERDVGCACGGGVGRFDNLRCDAFLTRD
jgi:hypothetical protein